MNPHYTYFIILAASFTGPLLLSFDKKVAFYKKWKYLFPAILFPALFFLVWDELKTRNGVWSFSNEHTIGLKLFSLPIEEILFFFIVPYCCVFVYECMRTYFPKIKNRVWGNIVFVLLFFVFLCITFLSYGKEYTFYTCLFTTLFILVLLIFKNWFKGFNASSFLISYAVIVIPFLMANGFLTAIPVVHYNNAENLGIRIENDILITEKGPVDLMAKIPIEVDEIEELMSRQNVTVS